MISSEIAVSPLYIAGHVHPFPTSLFSNMPSTTLAYESSRAALKHVCVRSSSSSALALLTFSFSNLMTDTFIANASAPELRAVIRSLLSTMSDSLVPFRVHSSHFVVRPAVNGTFSCIARSHLKQSAPCKALPPPSSLFTYRGSMLLPTPQFMEMLSHARMLFGVGMSALSNPKPWLTRVIFLPCFRAGS